jgi:hypothetical protein
MREIWCRKVIFITAVDNSLLKAPFGLKLLHLSLYSAKSQERVTFTLTLN